MTEIIEHEPKQCAYCGKTFVPIRSTKKYCSNNCRTLATLARQKAEKQRAQVKAELTEAREMLAGEGEEIADALDLIENRLSMKRMAELQRLEERIPDRLKGVLPKLEQIKHT